MTELQKKETVSGSQDNLQVVVDTVIKDEELVELNKEADLYVQKLNSEQNMDLSKVLSQLGDLGDKEQRDAGQTLSALKRPVTAMMNGKNEDIPNTLLDLRKVVSELDPNSLKTTGMKKIMYKVFKKNPMETYVHKYQSIDKQIEEIIRSLLVGRDNLQEDTVGLEMLKEQSYAKIHGLDKQVYLGRKLAGMLEVEKQNPERQKDIPLINDALEKILVRTRNMQQAKSVLLQSIASVDIIKKNNEKLSEAIRNAITMTQNVVTVSAAIQLALTNQRKTIDAVNATNEAIESMVLSNSQALKQNTEETTKLLENPAIGMDKLRESFQNVFAAIEASEKSSERIIESSKKFVIELDTFNDEMKQKLIRRPTK
ncbi:toxic anion resistance protein [Bacillus sp. DX1.1]|uniref:toxic anion resistance protein n=1 Tax=unclassified Bacillus (in: firmicutes) TaxID=185979 RepID=UPI0025700AF4|nr:MULTISPECIES: toxic anion resistance protein [unclassified Bacillus (in: firmicutes)]MDM5154950.1 toxic anion resistance protein [Bacillus sp. DX1.1]WJE83815.1 toxic anion resistance protein [Bacillus sp. DX3.1]